MAHAQPRIGFLFGYLAYEYGTGVWRGLLRAAEARGIELIAIEGSPDPAEPRAAKLAQISLIEGLALDGIVVSGLMGFTFLDEQIEAFLASLPSVPKVLIARSFADRPSVFVDNRAGIHSMVGHLVQTHNRRSIAFIAGHAHGGDAIQRYNAYREALDLHGLVYDPALVYRPSGEYDPFAGAKAVKAIWGDAGRRPDALVANNDDAAIAAVEELARRGFDVPGQVAVTGFDDIGPCLDAKPQITTVRQPHLEIGAAALELVLKAMHGGVMDPTPIAVPGVAVFRRSCGCSYSKAEACSRSGISARVAAAQPTVMEGLERLIDASLASRDADGFLDGLESAIREESSPDPLFELWLDRLKRLFASRMEADESAHPGAAALLYQAALERLGRATNIIERSRTAKTRNSYNVLNNFFSWSAFSFGTAGSGEALLESLPQLGIRDFMLCVYEETSERARVQRVIPAGISPGPLPGATGSPGELVGRFMDSRAARGRRGPLVLMRLYHDGGDLGFVICGVGSPDGSLYLALQSQLSNGLKGNALLEAVRGYSQDLEKKVKTLSGFLPICSSCKKIRDDKGYWNQVEAYISAHSEVEFSHSLCPECLKRLYPDLKTGETKS
ncbi:MAG: substrate-binding domain-containing protein [Spirochaetia bacterium]|jgi:DNA-binding LacI/PurR family transcriptional regulator